MFVCRAVFDEQNLYAGVCWSTPKGGTFSWKEHTGFVTILTSLNRNDLNMNLIKDGDLKHIVEQRADIAFRFGADGVICSPEEIKLLRKTHLRTDFSSVNYDDKLIVTPGIRSKQDDTGDQKRIATRSQAIKDGADYVVIGRPIYKANNPLEALRSL